MTTISQSAVADVIASVRKSDGEISKLRSRVAAFVTIYSGSRISG